MTSTSNFHKSFCLILKMHCSFYFIIWVHNDPFYSWSEFDTFRVQQKNKQRLLNFEGIANAFNISIESINNGFILKVMI
jgi:hypothetical protein